MKRTPPSAKGKKNSRPKKTDDKNVAVVAIGASAGGLDAMQALLKNLSPDTGLAYVFIQHLDPTHKSMLREILSRFTKMKVVEAGHMMRVEKNQLYVIPPGKDIFMKDGHLVLDKRKSKPA